MPLEMEGDHRVDGRSLVGVEVSERLEVVGQRSRLVASPGVERGHELRTGQRGRSGVRAARRGGGLRCPWRGSDPQKAVGRRPQPAGPTRKSSNNFDYCESSTHLHAFGTQCRLIPVLPWSVRKMGRVRSHIFARLDSPSAPLPATSTLLSGSRGSGVRPFTNDETAHTARAPDPAPGSACSVRGRPNSRVMKGHFAHRGVRNVRLTSCRKSCMFCDKNVFPPFSRVFGVAKVCRKSSELCDVFCDKQTDACFEKPLILGQFALGLFKWPLVTRLLGLPPLVSRSPIPRLRAQ